MIAFDGVSKSYGSKIVLSDFNADIPAGCVTAIMGESGCGKTTLLRLILGLEAPDSGRISGVPAHCAAVFQEDRLFLALSAEKNITMSLGRSADRTAVRTVLVSLGLGKDDIIKPAEQLSGGMRRRVAIARALLAQSELLVLDEPFKGLDAENMRRAAGVISSCAAGKTVLLVTHSADEAAALGAEKFISLAKKP